MKMKKGYVYALATAFVSGFSIWVNRFAVKGFDPILFTALKNALVALSFLFVVPKKSIPRDSESILKLILVAIFGGSFAFALFFTGLKIIDSSLASFIHKTMFIYISILAFVFLKEKISKNHVFGILFLLFGLYLISNVQSLTFSGAELIFLATFLWSVENIISKDLINHKISPNIVILARMGIGSIILFSLAFLQNKTLSLSFDQFVWLIFTACLLFVYVYTWYNSLRYIPVSHAAAILALGSVFTTLFSLNLAIFNLVGLLAMTIGLVIYFQPNILKVANLVK